MPRLALLALLVIILAPPLLRAQHVVLDVPPKGNQDVRAAEGGGQRVVIDAITPLPDLIKRLEGDWRLHETGKGYWIGYTDDMYSIAAHGIGAIAPLINLCQGASSAHSSAGGVLALHLIGIDRRIEGRCYEEFRNPAARKALLDLLDEERSQIQILRLLIRDPWPSDVPALIAGLERGGPNNWGFVKALQRYTVPNPPVHQLLDPGLATIACKAVPDSGGDYFSDRFAALSEASRGSLVVEPGLVGADLRGDWSIEGDFNGNLIGNVLENLTASDYCGLNYKLEHYVEEGVVYLCGIDTARARWLAWWKQLPEAEAIRLRESSGPTQRPWLPRFYWASATPAKRASPVGIQISLFLLCLVAAGISLRLAKPRSLSR